MKIFGIRITTMDSWNGNESKIEEFKSKKERNIKFEHYMMADRRFRAKQKSTPEVYNLYDKVFKIVN